MFAIACGKKFIKFDSFIFNVMVSSTPQLFKTEKVAKKILQEVLNECKDRIVYAKKQVERNQAANNKLQREIANAKALIAKLEVQPYCEVVHRMKNAESRLCNAANDLRWNKRNGAQAHMRAIARYEAILAAGLEVVEAFPADR